MQQRFERRFQQRLAREEARRAEEERRRKEEVRAARFERRQEVKQVKEVKREQRAARRNEVVLKDSAFGFALREYGFKYNDVNLVRNANKKIEKRVGELVNEVRKGLVEGPKRFFVSMQLGKFGVTGKAITLTEGTNIQSVINDATIDLLTKYDQLKENYDYEVDPEEHPFFTLTETRYRPIAGSSYIELPEAIRHRRCCINIQNEDEKCFRYCLLYHKHKIAKDAQRVSKYAKLDDFQLEQIGVEYPVKLQDIDKIEKHFNVTINVYTASDKCYVLPLRVSARVKTIEDHLESCNLLLVKDGDKQHYVYIKDLDLLCTRPKGADTNVSIRDKTHYCQRCLSHFYTIPKLAEHIESGCSDSKVARVVMPKRGKNICKFKEPRNPRPPFRIYADFESLLIKTDEEDFASRGINTSESTTVKINEHKVCGYGFVVVCDDEIGEVILKEEGLLHKVYHSKTASQIGMPTVRKFLSDMLKINDLLQEFLQNPDADVNADGESSSKSMYDIPVYFHNLKGYDSHFIIQAINERNFSNIDCIAQNMERFITFGCLRLKFLDSMAFVAGSLDKLVSGLSSQGRDFSSFEMLKLHCAYATDENIQFLCQKGEYPYEYMDSFQKLEERQLPSKENFFSKLSDSHISDADYARAQQAWQLFNCQTLADYHDAYLQLDVLLLADVFESFRKTMMRGYNGLDPCNYLSLPNYCWNAMLKMTNVELELLTDIDMHLMIEAGIRGGISMVSTRKAEANNPYLDSYNASLENSYIAYLDANNLYGHAMCRKLPKDGFEWVSASDFNHILEVVKRRNVNEMQRGYILECDLEYPQELHDSHSDYPLAPGRRTVTDDMLSSLQISMRDALGQKSAGVPKLVPDLYNKEKYVVHAANLKFYMQQGLRVTKIHRIIQFNQERWLQPYIEYNTAQRTRATTDLEKDLWKLCNNAVFGKTMENIRNRCDVRLAVGEERFTKLTSMTNYKCCRKIADDLVAVSLSKQEVELNKPIYAGFSILDLSKEHMYKFYYEDIKPRYGDKVRLLFTDTDSVCIHVETNDLYEDMRQDSHLYDFSEYPENHPCYSTANKKVVGKFKDETGSFPISRFIGLKAKNYCAVYQHPKKGEQLKMTGKGVKKSAFKKHFGHKQFDQCISAANGAPEQKQMLDFYALKSTSHRVFTVHQNKVALTPYDDKRYILPDGTSTLAHGHYKLRDE